MSMTKPEYKAVMKKHGLAPCSTPWLSILPTGETIKAIPLVWVPVDTYASLEQELLKEGFCFEWSTINFYYPPKGMWDRALVHKPAEAARRLAMINADPTILQRPGDLFSKFGNA